MLSGANTYTGGTDLTQAGYGYLYVGNNAALGTGTLVMGDLTRLDVAVDGLNLSNNISLAGEAVVSTFGSALTLGGTISGTGSLGLGGGVIGLPGVSRYEGRHAC